MKRVIASIAAGACLLFLTAGAAFAASSPVEAHAEPDHGT